MQPTYHWERLYHFSLSGHVDSWIVESNRVARRDIVGAPGFRSWFEDRNHWISPEFRAALERDMDASSAYQAMGIPDASSAGGGLERETA